MIVDGKYVNEQEVAFYADHRVEAEGHRIFWANLTDWLLTQKILQTTYTDPILRQKMHSECSCCGERVPMYFDGRDFIALNACKYRFGGVPLTFFLKVPSGTLAVANDLRSLAREPQDDGRTYYVNWSIGIVNTSLWYADGDMAHAFVGNSCPSLRRLTDEHYQVSNGHSTGDGFKDDYIEAPGERVASIITDLWWYSMMDGAVFEERGGTWDRFTAKVDVKPGLWRFVHHTEESTFNRDAYETDTIFTDITWAAGL